MSPSRSSDPDVLIVGAGPAGSTLAYLLAGLGWRVELLDRAHFPRPKPCGEMLNPGAVLALERMGLLESVLELAPAPIAGWTIRSDGGHGATGLFGRGSPGGLGVSRAALDHALVRRAIDRGVTLREGVRVMDVQRPPAPVRMVGKHPPGMEAAPPPVLEVLDESGARTLRSARFVVGADGLRSAVARRLGMVRAKPRLRKISLTCRIRAEGAPRETGLLYITDEGTVGLGPVEGGDDLWNATVVVDAKRGPELKGDAAGFFHGVFRGAPIEWNRGGPHIVGGPWPSGPFDWPARTVAEGKLLLVGDAAGYYDPLTGQGIFRALRSAELAAPAIDHALRHPGGSAEALKRYARLLKGNFRPGRRVQHLIESVLSRRRLREIAMSRLEAAPDVLGALIRVTGDESPARSMLRLRLLAEVAGLVGSGAGAGAGGGRGAGKGSQTGELHADD